MVPRCQDGLSAVRFQPDGLSQSAVLSCRARPALPAACGGYAPRGPCRSAPWLGPCPSKGKRQTLAKVANQSFDSKAKFPLGAWRMDSNRLNRRRALKLGGFAWMAGRLPTEARAQDAAEPASGNRVDQAAREEWRLPADVTTHHSVEFPDRTLQFTATAGAILLRGQNHAVRAELAFIAYQLSDADPTRRPVTFAFNGGPGFASGWLNVGAVGPWRISIGGDALAPSAAAEPTPNAETWLDFTDLVFIDPAGTGYSRAPDSGERSRRGLFSVDGDVAYLAEAVRHWLDRFDRNVSSKYLLGESYGGFRAPRI